jgi:hypothetical protein
MVKDTAGEDKISVKDFWKNFNIKKATNNIGDAWKEVSQSRMKGVWKKNWPYITDSHDFDPEIEIPNSRRDIVDSARAVWFEDVDEANVDGLIRSHTEELTNEDLLELEKD